MEGIALTGPAKEGVMGKLRLAMEHRELTLPSDIHAF
jgi:hypothetical protein